MDGVRVFDEHTQEYDRWFDKHADLYALEIEALKRALPRAGLAIEIGAGTGRFALPLGVQFGVDPSRRMAELAHARGLTMCQALGEALPFADGQFDVVLIVTVICFVADASLLLQEARRVLKNSGRLVLGFIDRTSALGRLYETRQATDTFYRQARFHSATDVAGLVRQAGFLGIRFRQTILGLPGEGQCAQRVIPGHGEGAFVVLSAHKPAA